MATVGEIEGLIDERKIGDDVVDDGVFENGPVLPRRIVGVTAADCACRSRFERNEHGTAPTFDQSCSDGPIGRHAYWSPVWPHRQPVQNMPDETAGFAQLIEAHGDTCRHISLAASDHHRRKLCVRLAGQVDAQIERLGARATREPGESQTRGELRSDDTGPGEPVAHALVLIVDRTQRQCFVCEFVHSTRRAALRRNRRGLRVSRRARWHPSGSVPRVPRESPVGGVP